MGSDLNKIPKTECDCDTCKGYCARRPCWGTPRDIKNLMELGYADRLMLDWWVADEDIMIICPAIINHGGKAAPFSPIGTCNFLTDKRLCEIHQVKPTEGKTASCKKNDYDVHHIVAMTWNSDEGRELVEKWKVVVGFEDETYKSNMLPDMIRIALGGK
jgi:hypothetical protein